ncbi:MAG TPA: YdcF family protein [Candidatus Sulfotelmatobacter sp.]|nr:YdcF family protein [Candidatus Sulfotelmatobacter sp.]
MTDDSAAARFANRSANRSSRLRFLRLAALVGTVAVAWLALTAVRVVHTASLEQAHPADAIVVFGAAQYSGHPSPVYRARLDHAYALYQSRVAPVIITTGGAGGDPKFSEGEVGRTHLMERGVPERNLIAETQGHDTAESAVRIAVIMRANGLHSCVAVSDAYHVFRIRELLEHEGIGPVYVAPRPDSKPHSMAQRLLAVLREAISYMSWKLGMT